MLPGGAAGQGARLRCGGARGTRGQCPGSLSGDAAGNKTESRLGISGVGKGHCLEKGLQRPGGRRDLAGVGLDGKSAGMGRECWSGKSVGGDYRTWNGAWQSDEVRVSWAGLWDTQGSVPGPEEGWETP